MLQTTLPRPYMVSVNLRPDEYDRIAATAKKFGVSRAEALRRNCPEFSPIPPYSAAAFRA